MTQTVDSTLTGYLFDKTGNRVAIEAFAEELKGLLLTMHAAQTALYEIEGPESSCRHLAALLLDRARSLCTAVGVN